MPATVQLHVMSAAETGADRTSGTARFHAIDSSAVDGSNVLVVPDAGTFYSYTITIRAYLAGAPAVSVGNLRLYSDGANGFGTGVGLVVKNVGVTFAPHYNTAMSGGASFFGYTSASPLDMDAVDAGPFVPADASSYIGDMVDLQMQIASTASQGPLTPEGATFAFDEV